MDRENSKIVELRVKYVQPVKDFWSGLEPPKRKKIGIAAIVLLILIIALVAYLNYTPYTVLYRDLDSVEAAEILTKLQEKGITVKMEGQGTIMVPENQEAALKMQLATEGYPKSGFSYDIYMNNVDTMATDSDRRTYQIFQLQNRMQEAVKTISGVKDAVVTITLPDNGNYVINRAGNEATASVLVTLMGTEDFSKGQVNGIKQLVSKGVLGLKTENVSVINSNTGKEMGSAAEDLSGEANDKLAIEQQIDERVEKKVGAILESFVGIDGFSVVATSRINTDAVLIQDKAYTPSDEENMKGIPSDESHYLEGNDQGILQYGVPGAQSNADDGVTTYPQLENGDNGNNFINKYEYDYYVNESKQEIKRQPVNIESISVSVVITNQNIEPSEEDALVELVAKAASVNPEDVVIYFANVGGTAPAVSGGTLLEMNRWVIIGLVAAVALIVIILIVMLLRRRRKAAQAAEAVAIAERIPVVEEKIPIVEETPQQAVARQVKEFASEHPEIAAQLIRTWLKGDD